MYKENYSLDVISHHSDFDGKSLKKYNLEGIETVGTFGDEPFEIVFKNNTYQKIQVKISIDGTDILTGQLANTEIGKDMWVVNGYGTLNIKAWPENNSGGSQLVFTSADKSVAVHTHGDLSHRGIIAAAVFTEGHVDPIRYNHYYYYNYPTYYWGGIIGTIKLNDHTTTTITCDTNGIRRSELQPYSSTMGGGQNVCQSNYVSTSCNVTENSNLVSVGAGDYVNQKIANTSGLIKPLFSETIRVRYLWWNELKNKLHECNYSVPHPSGFPGDKPIMSIGSTPKVSTRKIINPQTTEYSRF